MKQGIYNFLWLFGSLAIGCLWMSRPISAQIVPDATMPVNSIVTPQGNTLNITGGTSAGGNLFHSFREFSIPAGTTAHFNNSIDIQNIITRVTGGAISNIDGLIKANGTANLFLLNPRGIIFGPNASLNIGGSFLASTASSIKLADGNEFSATNPAAPPLLTVNVPAGLQLGQNPGGIVVRGAGHNLSYDPDTFAIIRENRPAGLQVRAGQTLALVGGDISLVGGNITAEEGRIILMSAGAGSYVSLIPNRAGWELDYSGVGNFQDIQLLQAASADVSGSGSGTIEVRGRRVTLSEGSAIIGVTEGGNAGGTLSVRAAESVEGIGTTADGEFPSGLYAEVSRGATGIGGNVTVETARLTLRDGAQISAATFGAGDGGTLTVRATESVDLIGTSADGSAVSGLFASTQPNSTGNGGNLTVETGRLTLRDGAGISVDTYGAGNGGNLTVETGRLTLADGAQISAGTFGAGDAGTLTVRARESVELIASHLFTDVNQGATGSGGNLTVETGRLTLRDGAQIAAGTFGVGDGGTLTVRATDSVDLIGTSADGLFPSGLFASAQPESTGNGGNLTVETGRLTVRDGAVISAGTFGAGDGGTLTVRARESVDLIGTRADGQAPSGLFASTEPESTGNGGNLTVETGRLTLRDGAQISAGTFGAGDAGTLTVRAPELVDAIGTSSLGLFASGLSTSTQPNSTGNGGDLTLETGRLTLRDGAQISAATFGAGDGGTLTVRATESVDLIGTTSSGQAVSGLYTSTQPNSTGNGGNLTVETGRLTVRDGAQIGVDTFGAGDAGTLTVRARESVELIGTSSLGLYSSGLFASAGPDSTGNGGNLTVETGRLIVRDGAQIGVDTFGAGDAGTLTVRATELVELIGSSFYAEVNSGATGNGGNLTVETGRLSLRDGAVIGARTFGAGDGGTLTVRARESVELIGSSFYADVNSGATGSGGDVRVETGRLSLRDGAVISADTYGAGDAGTLTVRATESVELIGTSSLGQAVSGLFGSAQSKSTGNGGNLTVETGRLTLADGAQVTAATFGAGDAGTLTVRATESVELIGTSSSGQYPSGLFASNQPESTGNGGNLTVETGRLTLRDGARIAVSTSGAGDAGTLTVRATESVDVIGTSISGRVPSGLFASAEANSTGNGGNLTLETGRLTLRDGAQIGAATFGAGDAGTLTVRATEWVDAIGTSADGQTSSGLFTSTQPNSTGNGGNLTVETGRLTLRDGAQIATGTFGAGDAGTLTVRATESVELIGTTPDGQAASGLYASAQPESTGNGGNLTVETGRLTVRDGAGITASSLGTGAAGNLTVSASAIRLDNQASVRANTSAGGGNITLNTGTIQLRRNSGITTNAQGNSPGGNITFNTHTLAALENSDISANSQENFGGKVTINAQGVFGTQYRLAPTSNSDITATGGSPQLNGVVTINTPDADPTSGLIALPSQLRDVTGLINNPCAALARGSSFTVTGRGGIPQSPTDPLTGTALAVDWISPPKEAPAPPTLTQKIPKSPNPGSPPPLAEAQGWVISSTGTVTLTANPPNGTPHGTWQVPANCPASR